MMTPARFGTTQNVDPRDNTPTADQVEARRRANEPEVDKQGHKTFGGGGVKLKFERDYWPAQQPEIKFDPNDLDPATGRPRIPVHREHVIKAGEVASVPSKRPTSFVTLVRQSRIRIRSRHGRYTCWHDQGRFKPGCISWPTPEA